MRILCGFLLLAAFCCSLTGQEAWQPLFNGRDLAGWTQVNGEARYEVVGDEIVGTSVPDTPNSFLITEKHFSDFILEFEVKVDTPLNSGVQIRSHSLSEYRDGRVHGYQIEIDPSPRAWSGGVYDEARRGWLYPVSYNESCRTAFRLDRWNHYRVEAIGPSLRTFLNGVPCADLIDDMTAKGFIGLQVHGIGNDRSLAGKEVRWRNVRILTDSLEAARSPDNVRTRQVSYLPNHVTERERRLGWRLLWDGKTTRGWRGAKLKRFPDSGWKIGNGILTVLPSGGGESSNGGDIVTIDRFSDFELEVDFRISEGANSGIKYFVNTELNKGEGSAIGLEFQILDDRRHPDASLGVGGNRTIGSLYDLIPAVNLAEPDRPIRFKGIGQWNRARIVARGSHVEHWLNGVKLLEYERGTQIFRALVAKSKYHVWPNFGEAESGHILLQDHGDEVSFRSIKIREF